MTGRFHRLAAAAALVVAAHGVADPAPLAAQDRAGAWTPTEDDYLLLQLTLGKYTISNEVRGYQTRSGVCLDLADVIQSLDLPIRLDKKSRRATGWLFAEDQQFTIDREANKVQNGNKSVAPLEGEIHDTPEGWCVEIDALSRWFGVGMKADLYSAAIRLDAEAKLPFIEALERRSRAARLRTKIPVFDLAKYPQAKMDYRMWRTPSVDTVVRAGYTTGGGRSQFSTSYETYVSGELGKVSYTARTASGPGLLPKSLRLTAYRNDPAGQMLGPLGATQIAAGDVQTEQTSLTARSQVGRGAFVSNRPIGRASRFSTTDLRGILPAGWDAELYRNGQLVSFQSDRSDGRYEFLDLDLYFGRNDFEVVLYGPQGQIRRVRESVPVGQTAIEPGKTYYWAGMVQDGRDLFGLDTRNTASGRWRWGVGVERGLDRRTSIGVGAQSIWVAGKRREYLEGNVYRSLGAMQLALSGAQERGGGTLLQANALGTFRKINYAADVTWMRGDFTSEFASPELAWRASFRADTSLRLGRVVLPIRAGIGRATFKDGREVTEWLMGTAFNVARTSISAELRSRVDDPGEVDAEEFAARSDGRTELRLLASRRVLGLSLRGAADFLLSGPDKGFRAARLNTSIPVGAESDLTAQIE